MLGDLHTYANSGDNFVACGVSHSVQPLEQNIWQVPKPSAFVHSLIITSGHCLVEEKPQNVQKVTEGA